MRADPKFVRPHFISVPSNIMQCRRIGLVCERV
jgi:hypothetical protein